jgi:hypothetical protein
VPNNLDGGIKTDEFHRTNIEGVDAAGDMHLYFLLFQQQLRPPQKLGLLLDRAIKGSF